jgi:hypothetical protein
VKPSIVCAAPPALSSLFWWLEFDVASPFLSRILGDLLAAQSSVIVAVLLLHDRYVDVYNPQDPSNQRMMTAVRQSSSLHPSPLSCTAVADPNAETSSLSRLLVSSFGWHGQDRFFG